ncbi:MAG: glycosyltransferase [bacterium]|nr:glycosyltransferase [bacterium]
MTKLSLLLPSYNEATVLPWSVRTLAAYASKALADYDWKIVIVDNASSDNTQAVMTDLQNEQPRLGYLRVPVKGRGIALRTAWTDLDYDVSLYMDVDLAVALDAVKPVVDAVAHDHADIAVGSRYAPGAKIERSVFRSVTSIGYNVLTKLFVGLRTRDAQCGFKAIRKDVALQLLPLVRDTKWFFDTELLVRAERRGLRVVEIPVSWVETRPALRKSKVKVLHTIFVYIVDLARLRWAIVRHQL